MQNKETEPRFFQAIVAELQSMVDIDQAMRKHNLEHPDEWDESIDRRNTQRLKEIVEEIGWPINSKVGESGSYDAWLLIQHADHDPEFQKKCLELMKSAPEGEVSKRDIAYLEDRIAIGQKLPQIYGTQFHNDKTGN